MIFHDRTTAGKLLAQRLSHLKGKNVVVLGLPRGGVPVAFEVARDLNAPLDVIVVRKLGVPFQPELAMGAIGEGEVVIRNEEVIRMASITVEDFERAKARESQEVASRATRFREGRSRIALKSRLALIVDDGIATGSTAQAACDVARELGADQVVLAVPVGSREAIAALTKKADEVICLDVPDNFFAVGQWYEDFSAVSDEEVIDTLRKAHTWSKANSH
ncbi:MAG TPA: phosphoribosyltransferase [Candidatus Nanopelagicaceae bacterium]|jgi:putative phosphoribosyl transferase